MSSTTFAAIMRRLLESALSFHIFKHRQEVSESIAPSKRSPGDPRGAVDGSTELHARDGGFETDGHPVHDLEAGRECEHGLGGSRDRRVVHSTVHRHHAHPGAEAPPLN